MLLKVIRRSPHKFKDSVLTRLDLTHLEEGYQTQGSLSNILWTFSVLPVTVTQLYNRNLDLVLFIFNCFFFVSFPFVKFLLIFLMKIATKRNLIYTKFFFRPSTILMYLPLLLYSPICDQQRETKADGAPK